MYLVKTKMLSISVFCIFLIFAGMGCKDEAGRKDCGCDSDNKTYVADLTGILQKDSVDGYYIYKQYPGPMYSFDMICNQEKVQNIALGSRVTYSGYRAVTCDSAQFSTGRTFKEVIAISKIEVNP